MYTIDIVFPTPIARYQRCKMNFIIDSPDTFKLLYNIRDPVGKVLIIFLHINV